ncbi:MAG: diacylglycerol kinase family lipid kinase [Acidobacteria bacterium]|nr:diacylglycerol kinase family lipid kinase [Acidobacteriota bacterium]
MKIGVIINPASGPARSRQPAEILVEWTRAMLRRHGVDGSIAVIHGPGDGERLAREAVDRGAERVIAWGGDGTINSVATALVKTHVSLGIIPAGSGNGLARELGIPSRRASAMAVALGDCSRAIDAGTLNGHLFFNVAGIGFDAHVAHVFARAAGHRRGVMAYTATTVRELFRYVPSRYVVRDADGRVTREGGALFISMANTRQWGSGAQIAPQATPDDGHLDLVLVEARPPLLILAQLWRLYTGSVHRIGGTMTALVQDVSVTASPAAPVHVDGEPLGMTSDITVRVIPGALLVRVPG